MNESYPLALQTTYRDLLDRHLRHSSPEIVGSVLGPYALELGVRLEHALAQTEDVDVAADRSVTIIAGERTSLTGSLEGLGLRPVAGPWMHASSAGRRRMASCSTSSPRAAGEANRPSFTRASAFGRRRCRS